MGTIWAPVGESRQRVQATASGTIHAVLASWEVTGGQKLGPGDRPAETRRFAPGLGGATLNKK